jgi:hypothetical protein
MTVLIIAFRNYAKAPKIQLTSHTLFLPMQLPEKKSSRLCLCLYQLQKQLNDPLLCQCYPSDVIFNWHTQKPITGPCPGMAVAARITSMCVWYVVLL